jgi:hypothetical protein
MTTEFQAGPVSWVATAIQRVHENALARYEGSVDTLELLMQGGALTQVCISFMVVAVSKLIF